MLKMMCTICGHIYDPERGDEGVDSGIPFDRVPADWNCPVCGAEKSRFIPAT
ncbi:MAG: rubredoxin [Methanomicrobiales archaeon]|nr:rubredoxin [Methanomicrobiales archaeon]